MPTPIDFQAIRRAIASLPADVSNDAIGAHAPHLDEIYAYLPPVQPSRTNHERELYTAMEKIGVMLRRKDGRIDMPDLFRVAAKLLKKGGTAPL